MSPDNVTSLRVSHKPTWCSRNTRRELYMVTISLILSQEICQVAHLFCHLWRILAKFVARRYSQSMVLKRKTLSTAVTFHSLFYARMYRHCLPLRAPFRGHVVCLTWEDAFSASSSSQRRSAEGRAVRCSNVRNDTAPRLLRDFRSC